ncbi:hypothetical protein RCOM_0680890 [Ricinus communis]|uniref:Threonyl/alanyl tRNA synthetase SAD domain-containing protein n=1 Tax=Ricinus communis TaxID=3988 RepID=B9RT44_RICCO|nr:hypothetical protein RCOM_0680890 [Ricinus communis]
MIPSFKFIVQDVRSKDGTAHAEFQQAKEIEAEANALISRGGEVSTAVLPYEEASYICCGCLTDYISKRPSYCEVREPSRLCGGTHVSDILEIISMKVSQIRTKKRND